MIRHVKLSLKLDVIQYEMDSNGENHLEILGGVSFLKFGLIYGLELRIRLGAPGSATPGAPHASLVAFDWRQISWGAPPTDPGG
jgi:hypothetical protein